MAEIHLITGYLGSGKTQFLSCLLERKLLSEKIAVIVNNFGAVMFDGIKLQAASGADGIETIDVPGGCRYQSISIYWQQNALHFAYGFVFWHRRRIPKHTRQIDSFLNRQYRLSMLPNHPSGDYDFLVVELGTGCSVLAEPIFVYIACWLYAARGGR
jgi:hypothetical protein